MDLKTGDVTTTALIFNWLDRDLPLASVVKFSVFTKKQDDDVLYILYMSKTFCVLIWSVVASVWWFHAMLRFVNLNLLITWHPCVKYTINLAICQLTGSLAFWSATPFGQKY